MNPGLNPIEKQRLEILNGCEVRSLKHEGVVSIKGYEVKMGGEVVETITENRQVNYLWRQYVKAELGTRII